MLALLRFFTGSKPPLETGRTAPAAEIFRPTVAKTEVPRRSIGKKRAGRLRGRRTPAGAATHWRQAEHVLPARLAPVPTTIAACVGRTLRDPIERAHGACMRATPSTCPLPCARVRPCEDRIPIRRH